MTDTRAVLAGKIFDVSSFHGPIVDQISLTGKRAISHKTTLVQIAYRAKCKHGTAEKLLAIAQQQVSGRLPDAPTFFILAQEPNVLR